MTHYNFIILYDIETTYLWKNRTTRSNNQAPNSNHPTINILGEMWDDWSQAYVRKSGRCHKTSTALCQYFGLWVSIPIFWAIKKSKKTLTIKILIYGALAYLRFSDFVAFYDAILNTVVVFGLGFVSYIIFT